jgi:hypothetical protein
MSRAAVLILVVALAAGGCLWFVLSGQYAAGNIYAEYSSQRTDRMGTAALYEALSRLGRQVSRNELPLNRGGLRNSEILVLGLSPGDFTTENIAEIEEAARNGNRVVVAMNAAAFIVDYKKINQTLWDHWRVKIVDSRKIDDDRDDSDTRARGFVTFDTAPDAGWAGSGSLVSRTLGKGSVVLMGSSWAFTNVALKDTRDISTVQSAVGNAERIVFDETHLGTVQTGTVMGLVRQFRLQGFLGVVIVCALLFIWQSSSPFPPERLALVDADTKLAAASASEGLVNLLTCHIPANRIMTACVEEWRKDRGRLVSEETLARIKAVTERKAHPVAQWREIRALLDKKLK